MSRRHLFVAGMFRAGGVHIASSLSRLTGKPLMSTASIDGHGNEEQAVNPFVAAVLFNQGASVFHQHTRAFCTNVRTLKWYDVAPIILVRNLADTVVSVIEKIDEVIGAGAGIPGLIVPGEWPVMTRHQKEAWAIDNVVPWQISFVAGWYAATYLRKDIDAIWVRYEEFFADQPAGFAAILRFASIDISDLAMRHVAADTQTKRFGVAGRGKYLDERIRLDARATAWGPLMYRPLMEYLA